ncbi:hypothetical protein GCM10009117_12620 [Gangjinia marincola]|uniref:GAF domain-containing protein n=1 Tax=Gangjinia marincola TaxID=578463 RepID=A0ABP3XUR3_9FLAO
MRFVSDDFPLKINISFKKLFSVYEQYLNEDNELLILKADRILRLKEDYPKLVSGLTNKEEVEAHRDQIDLALSDIFTDPLQDNEIKLASIPFDNSILKSTRRYNRIIEAAGEDFEPTLRNFDEDQFYIMGCSFILMFYYNHNIDFRRPFLYDIPSENGITRYYRVMYNADFVSVEKTENSVEITQEDVDELLDNFNNIDLWREKFPPRSWNFKGFTVASLFDITTDVALSTFKENLLKAEDSIEFVDNFTNTFKAIFNLPELSLGFSEYNDEEKTFERIPFGNFKSYILNKDDEGFCQDLLCKGSYYSLIGRGETFSISDVERYLQADKTEILYNNLLEQGIRSAILAPINKHGKFLGTLEITSPNVRELNSINANKLKDIMPFLVEAISQSRDRIEDQLELIIQDECTSIHPSVYWKFRKEAKRYLKATMKGEQASFREIVFDDVYPLYGQIDIKGSSDSRNIAIQKDLVIQLKRVKEILYKAHEISPMPIYSEMLYQVEELLEEIKDELQVDTEQRIAHFISKEIKSVLNHLRDSKDELRHEIQDYLTDLDNELGLIYKHRADFDDSVMIINKRLSRLLDQKQKAAQKMYPHFYERFKTDGVEHNMYIGESITKEDSFNEIYLYNLRLWQLQVMCEMENEYYRLKKTLPVDLDVASMILAFQTSLSVRFRMDEKRFDVDGTYNARYEVVKKRVDKANIKGTQERITQPGKIAIIYSQKSDQREYLRYIKFLQSKKYLDDKIEKLELQDLQGVTGLKALRVKVLYRLDEDEKEYYTYEDLMQEINA